MHHVAVGIGWRDLGQVLGHGLTGARHDVAMDESGVEQMLQHHRHTTDAMQIGHVVLAAGLGVGDVRHASGDAVEVVELERNASLVGDGQKMQNGIGTAPERVVESDGVLERLLREDVARTNPETQHVDDRFSGAPCVVLATHVDGRSRSRSGQRQTEGLADRRHRVGGEHATTCPLTRTRRLFDLGEFTFGDGAGRTGADGLEHRRDVDVLAVVATRKR